MKILKIQKEEEKLNENQNYKLDKSKKKLIKEMEEIKISKKKKY